MGFTGDVLSADNNQISSNLAGLVVLAAGLGVLGSQLVVLASRLVVLASRLVVLAPWLVVLGPRRHLPRRSFCTMKYECGELRTVEHEHGELSGICRQAHSTR